MTLTSINLKPEQVQELLKSCTPGPWSYFPKRKYNEHHVSVPLGDGSQMSLGLFPDGVPTAHPEADGQLIALAPELAQGYVTLHAAALALVQVDAEHRAWLEVTPPWLRDEGQGGFTARFHSAYSALAALVQPSAASAGAAASGGAGDQPITHDLPERIPYESAVLDEETGLPFAEIQALEWADGRQLVEVVLLGAEVIDLEDDEQRADVAVRCGADMARVWGEQLVRGAGALGGGSI